MRDPSEAMIFAASRFTAHADEIARQWTDPDIREICEHMQLEGLSPLFRQNYMLRRQI